MVPISQVSARRDSPQSYWKKRSSPPFLLDLTPVLNVSGDQSLWLPSLSKKSSTKGGGSSCE